MPGHLIGALEFGTPSFLFQLCHFPPHSIYVRAHGRHFVCEGLNHLLGAARCKCSLLQRPQDGRELFVWLHLSSSPGDLFLAILSGSKMSSPEPTTQDRKIIQAQPKADRCNGRKTQTHMSEEIRNAFAQPKTICHLRAMPHSTTRARMQTRHDRALT